MAPSKPKTGERMPMANDGGQKPPTESNPVRQHYQMACHGNGNGGGTSRTSRTSRIPTRSRQFNRGGRGGSY